MANFEKSGIRQTVQNISIYQADRSDRVVSPWLPGLKEVVSTAPEKLMCKAFATTDPDLINLKYSTPFGELSGVIRTALRLYLYIKKHQPNTPVEKIAERYRQEFIGTVRIKPLEKNRIPPANC